MVDVRNDGNITNLIHSVFHRLRAQPAPIDGITMTQGGEAPRYNFRGAEYAAASPAVKHRRNTGILPVD
jgi:hypothetical protein